MNKVLLLFKKDITEAISVFKHKGTRRDIIGVVSSFLLLAIIYGAFVYVFKAFGQMYLGTVFDNPQAISDRVFEVMTAVYGVVLIINIFVGIKNIYSSISDSKDCNVLITQPISAWSIFFYKLLKIYLSQLLSSALILTPVAVVLDVLTPIAGGVGYYFLLLLSVVTVPLISCALASLLSIPYIAVMRFVNKHFVLHLIVYIVVIAVGFWIYSQFLNVLTSLLKNGEIRYTFDRNTINFIHSLTTNLYPANLFANMLFDIKIWQSILLVIGCSAVAGTVSYFVVRTLYSKIIQKKLEGEFRIYRKPQKHVFRSVTATLLNKEFLTVLRTPSYAFQYFATTVTLPFMVFICVNLLKSMMSTITVISCDYELAMFVIAMFTVLTNTFCTTNISRDGKMFSMLKTMPVNVKDIVRSKLIFCMIVSSFSVLVSCIALAVGGFLNIWQVFFVLVMALMLSFAEIAFATRRDMKRPTFPSGESDELEESNSNVSLLMLIGLIVSAIAGGGSVALTAVLSIISEEATAIWASVGFVFGIITIIFVAACFYLFKGLRKQYYNSEY